MIELTPTQTRNGRKLRDGKLIWQVLGNVRKIQLMQSDFGVMSRGAQCCFFFVQLAFADDKKSCNLSR